MITYKLQALSKMYTDQSINNAHLHGYDLPYGDEAIRN